MLMFVNNSVCVFLAVQVHSPQIYFPIHGTIIKDRHSYPKFIYPKTSFDC